MMFQLQAPGSRKNPADKDRSKPLPVSSVENALSERVKELNCLYGISNLFENQDVSLSWIMQRAVEPDSDRLAVP